jgi:hypothetical protein
MPSNHINNCSCSGCQSEALSKAEKEMHVQLSENSRRDFLRRSSRLGLGLGIGGGLVSTPIAAAALNNEDAAYKAASMGNNKAVKDGKATKVTLLHTADIHAQLHIHDEFFVENGKNVFKKRGGYATLKTMINTLRNENKANTLLMEWWCCSHE